MNVTMNRTEWVLLIVLSVIWGGTFVFVEVALEDLIAAVHTIEITSVSLIKSLVLNGKITIINREN